MARNYTPASKGGTWGDGRNLPQITEADGSYSEGIAAFLRAWNENTLAYQKLIVDPASGALKVTGVGTSTVTATDLDIRNLSSGQDSVSAVQGTSPWVVSAAALPLPTGAATETTLAAIQTLVDGLATAGETQPVSLASLPALAAGTNNIGDVDVLSMPAVALDAGTLAALETIDLGATSLAALETIELGASTLSALESVTAVGPLTDTELRAVDVDVIVTAEPATAAAQATALPDVLKAIGVWDGQKVLPLAARNVSGLGVAQVEDDSVRRLLEQVLIELRVLNNNFAVVNDIEHNLETRR